MDTLDLTKFELRRIDLRMKHLDKDETAERIIIEPSDVLEALKRQGIALETYIENLRAWDANIFR